MTDTRNPSGKQLDSVFVERVASGIMRVEVRDASDVIAIMDLIADSECP